MTRDAATKEEWDEFERVTWPLLMAQLAAYSAPTSVALCAQADDAGAQREAQADFDEEERDNMGAGNQWDAEGLHRGRV